MSTFFLSLLSRTLQTLLSKYLCDVDVEGVALPSYFNSDEGYGVRLKNVKLRDKTKLLDLPGQWQPSAKRKRRTKQQQQQQERSWKQHRRKPPTDAASADSSSVSEDNHLKGSCSNQQQDPLENSTPNTKSSPAPVAPPPAPSGTRPKFNRKKSSWFSSWYYGIEQEEDVEDEDGKKDVEGEKENDKDGTNSSRSQVQPTEENVKVTEKKQTFPETNCENLEERPKQQHESQPPKSPPVRTTSWFSSWFYGKESVSENENDIGTDNDDDDDDDVVTPNNDRGMIALDDHHPPKETYGGTPPQGTTPAPNYKHDTNHDPVLTPLRPSSTTDPLIGTFTHQPLAAEHNNDLIHHDENGVILLLSDNTSSPCPDDDDETNDGRIPRETGLILRLGEGGTIGVLDVRVVGKTIHVLIEDAVLTVEVVRIRKQSPADSSDGNTNNNNNNHNNKSSLSNPQTSSTTTTTTASTDTGTKKNNTNLPEPKTTGDRVLAENAIAKIFSAIPNLFLRDIRIRVIIREDEIVSVSETDGNEEWNKPDSLGSSDDTIIDIAIELLSVNEGDDFLTNFGAAMSGADGEGSDMDSQQDSERSFDFPNNAFGQILSSAGASSDSDDKNEYLLKRIRTGRGPEGGIILKIFNASEAFHIRQSKMTDSLWARDRWYHTTQSVVLRCSGLDLLARIFLGTKKEVAISNNSWYADDNEYSDFDVDAMLFGGVDYIVPGPQPPLPPHTPVHIQNGDNAWRSGTTRCYTTDDNEIQSCGVPSYFHKIARGLCPMYCDASHLPCDNCDCCWNKDCSSSSSHKLDSSIPMGGLVCHVSIRDPLEINLDRDNLDTIGRLLNIFTRKSKAEPEQDSNLISSVAPDDEIQERSLAVDDSRRSQFSKKENPRFVDECIKSSKTPNEKHRRSVSKAGVSQNLYQEHECSAAYPSYMKPEKIQLLGFYVAEIKIRIHVLKTEGAIEDGYSFCYWDLFGFCVTADFQKLSALERPFQDFEIDVAQLSLSECKGMECKQLLSIGTQQRIVGFDDSRVPAFVPQKQQQRLPWPNTAASLLDLSPPLESMVYEDRRRHALLLRYIAVLDQSDDCSRSRRVVHVRLGRVSADIPFAVRNDIMAVISECRETVLGPPNSPQSSLGSAVVDSTLKYKVTALSGNILLTPLIQANFPLTTVVGELSTRAGFSVQSFLNQVNAQFGQSSEIWALDSGLSLQQLANLPDNIRLRMLLFLEDLKPLEEALGIQKTSNPFLRTRECNKGIVKLARKQTRRNKQKQKKLVSTRRQELMNELMSLDDDTLESLLRNHQSSKGKKIDDRAIENDKV